MQLGEHNLGSTQQPVGSSQRQQLRVPARSRPLVQAQLQQLQQSMTPPAMTSSLAGRWV